MTNLSLINLLLQQQTQIDITLFLTENQPDTNGESQ